MLAVFLTKCPGLVQSRVTKPLAESNTVLLVYLGDIFDILLMEPTLFFKTVFTWLA